VYLNESLSSLRFVDLFVSNSSVLPSLGIGPSAFFISNLQHSTQQCRGKSSPCGGCIGAGVGVTSGNSDFAAVMATKTAVGQLCLQLFLHCPQGSESDCP
jgi:hypothetical protein